MNTLVDPDAREWTDLVLDSGLSVTGTNVILGPGALVMAGGMAAEDAPDAVFESPEFVVMSRTGVETGLDRPSATGTGLPDASVDLVVMRSAYRGIMEMTKAFGEAARILRSGGGFFVADYSPSALAGSSLQAHPSRLLTMMFPEVADRLASRHPNSVDIAIAAVRAGIRDIDGWDVEDYVMHFEDYEDHQLWVAQGGWRGFEFLTDEQKAALVAALPATMRRIAPNNLIRESEPWTVARGYKG